MKVSEFWNWFLLYEWALRDEIFRQKQPSLLLQTFSDNLSRYNPDLGFTLYSNTVKRKIYCHITLENANTCTIHRNQLFQKQPKTPYWVFKKGMKPHDDFIQDSRELEFTCDTTTIKTKQIKYQLLSWCELNNKFELVIYLPVVFSTSTREKIHGFIFLILSTLYGDTFIVKYILKMYVSFYIRPVSNISSLDNLKLEIECFFDDEMS